MAPHSSTLAWKIPWTKEPGGLQSMRSLRVGHNWVTSLSFLCIGEGNGNPLQCSCLENSRNGRAWWAAVYGVAQSRTRLKWLSSYTKFLPSAWTHHTPLPFQNTMDKKVFPASLFPSHTSNATSSLKPFQSHPVSPLEPYLHYQFTWTLTVQNKSITNYEAQKQANQIELMNGYKTADWT